MDTNTNVSELHREIGSKQEKIHIQYYRIRYRIRLCALYREQGCQIEKSIDNAKKELCIDIFCFISKMRMSTRAKSIQCPEDMDATSFCFALHARRECQIE